MLALVQAERIPQGAIWSHMATNTCQCFFFFSKANSCTDTEHIHQRESYRKPILNLDKIALAGWISYSCTSPTGLPPVTDRRSHLQPGEASSLIRQGLWGAQKIVFHAGKEMCLCLLCQHVRRHKPPLTSHTRKVILCFSPHLWDGIFLQTPAFTCVHIWFIRWEQCTRCN